MPAERRPLIKEQKLLPQLRDHLNRQFGDARQCGYFKEVGPPGCPDEFHPCPIWYPPIGVTFLVLDFIELFPEDIQITNRSCLVPGEIFKLEDFDYLNHRAKIHQLVFQSDIEIRVMKQAPWQHLDFRGIREAPAAGLAKPTVCTNGWQDLVIEFVDDQIRRLRKIEADPNAGHHDEDVAKIAMEEYIAFMVRQCNQGGILTRIPEPEVNRLVEKLLEWRKQVPDLSVWK